MRKIGNLEDIRTAALNHLRKTGPTSFDAMREHLNGEFIAVDEATTGLVLGYLHGEGKIRTCNFGWEAVPTEAN